MLGNLITQTQLVVEKYWLFLSTLVIALLSFWIYRDGSKISDLQQQAARQKLDGQLANALNQSRESIDDYQKSIDTYHRLKSHYESLFGSKP